LAGDESSKAGSSFQFYTYVKILMRGFTFRQFKTDTI